MKHYKFERPEEVKICTRVFEFDYDGTNKTIHNLSLLGGCSGYTKAVSALIEGKTVEEIVKSFKNINCGDKKTSCPQFFAQKLEETFLSRFPKEDDMIVIPRNSKPGDRFDGYHFISNKTYERALFDYMNLYPDYMFRPVVVQGPEKETSLEKLLSVDFKNVIGHLLYANEDAIIIKPYEDTLHPGILQMAREGKLVAKFKGYGVNKDTSGEIINFKIVCFELAPKKE